MNHIIAGKLRGLLAVMVRKARIAEHKILTDISFKSKNYWNYPPEYFQIWEKELTITEDYIKNNIVYVYEKDYTIIGYYSLIENKIDNYFGKVFVEKGWWLEHLFILPNYINQGFGTKLVKHLCNQCKMRKIDAIKIFADPNSEIFYEKINAKFIRESASSIDNRKIPVFELNIKHNCD